MPTFDATDFDNAVSESGTVHESTANTDHTDASQLKQGYDIANPYLSADLIGYWPLQEDSGSTAYDFSGNNNDGTINGATVNVEGLLNTSAYSFDGTGDYIVASPSPLPDTMTNITISFWAKKVDTGSDNAIIQGQPDDDGSDRLNIHFPLSNGTIYWDFGDINNAGRLTTSWDSAWYGSWTHFAFISEDGVGQSIYVNGTKVASDTSSDTVGTTDFSDLVWSLNGNTAYWKGDLADARIYNRALSASEIQTLYDVVATKGDLTTQFKTV